MHIGLFILKMLFGPHFLFKYLFEGLMLAIFYHNQPNYRLIARMSAWTMRRVAQSITPAIVRAAGVPEVEDFTTETNYLLE